MLKTTSPWRPPCTAHPASVDNRPHAIPETLVTDNEPEMCIDAETPSGTTLLGKSARQRELQQEMDAMKPLISSLTCTTTTIQAPKQDRHIRFGAVDVASYYMTLGSNPGGTSGPPIELGDQLATSQHFSSVECHLEISHPYRHPDDYKLANRMSRALREEIVARYHTEDEICHEVKAAFDIRRSRSRSAKEDILRVWMEEEKRAQEEQRARDADLLAGLNRGAERRRTGERRKKSVSWLSPSFLGKPSDSGNKESSSVGIPSSERDEMVNVDGPGEKVDWSNLGVVRERTGRRRVKSRSCPSGLFTEKHIGEHDAGPLVESRRKKQVGENLIPDPVESATKKCAFSRLFFRGRR